MSQTTPQMGLTKWDIVNDFFSHTQLGANFDLLDAHDHTAGKGVQIPTGGIGDLAVSGDKIQSGAVATTKLADGSVTTAKVADGAIGAAKIATGAVSRSILSQALIQTVRVSTGSINASSNVSVTATFAQPFADTNFTVTVGVEQATASTSTLAIHHMVSKSTTQVVVRVKNDDSGGAHTGTLHVVAVHD